MITSTLRYFQIDKLEKLKLLMDINLFLELVKRFFRALYSDFPTKAERSTIDLKEKSRLKAYCRKYPTRAQQKHHSIDAFVQEKSAFNMVKEKVQECLNGTLVTIYSKDKHSDGTVKLIKFMTILQKLTSLVYKGVLKEVFNRDPDDDENKTAAAQRKLRNELSKENNVITEWVLIGNHNYIYETLIPGIVATIDGLKFTPFVRDAYGQKIDSCKVEDDYVTADKAGSHKKEAPIYLTKGEMADRLKAANRRKFIGTTPITRKPYKEESHIIKTRWDDTKKKIPWRDIGEGSSSFRLTSLS
jgi:hypothetical protein